MLAPAICARKVCKRFVTRTKHVTQALDGVSFEMQPGAVTALVGPDGAGKTTLMRLLAGLLRADSGELSVFGIDPALDPQRIQNRIGYMPQRFGLYEDLSVLENLDLYADLHAVFDAERRSRYSLLMDMTRLDRFMDRQAGRLSGGMKQKLGLACTLVSQPELLLLDEPTVGVDPLSRRELWEIIRRLTEQQQLTVLMSTSYLDEAERCQQALILHEGKTIAYAAPAQVKQLAAGHAFIAHPLEGRSARELQRQLLDDPTTVDAVPDGGRVRWVRASPAISNVDSPQLVDAGRVCGSLEPVPPRFEDGLMMLLQQRIARPSIRMSFADRTRAADGEVVVHVDSLSKRFGVFVAVDGISFDVRRGEIVGLLGANGAGKTTTFRMLCGLLSASSGTLTVAGVDLRHARASARQNIGYVAQKFSLYGELTVGENLDFYASAYGLQGQRKRDRIQWALEQFDLEAQVNSRSEELPGGYKQRLAMSAALLHEPQILFLDEPTSGIDAFARRLFWRRINALAEQGVTIIVTTHFMEEAEYCDRVVILDSGRVLIQGTPSEIRRHGAGRQGPDLNMEESFIAIVEAARQPAASVAEAAA